MELTPRLQAIADQVPPGARLADIGTDHAYLPVWLLLREKISNAIAADLRIGPLSRAQETAEQFGIKSGISFRLCDGLSDIRPDEADVIVIAGMGGETIVSILQAAPWSREKTLLLQPMTGCPDLRLWLQQNGYCIEKERTVCEGKRLYTIWTVMGGAMPPYTPAELWAGRDGSDPLRDRYLSMVAGKVEKMLRGQQGSSALDADAIASLTGILAEIRRMERSVSHSDNGKRSI